MGQAAADVQGAAASRSSRPHRARSLWPREHGAYAQLAIPQVTALALGWPTLAAALIALAACAAFLAHEPLLVVLGHRGARMREHDGPRAKRRLVQLAMLAAVAGTIGLAAAPRAALAVASVPACAAAVLVAFASRRAQHSRAGELAAAIALPAAAAPVAVASGVSVRDALVIAGAWSIGYASTVFAVHRVIARHRTAASRVDTMHALALTAIAAACVASAGLVEPLASVAAPLAIASIALVIRPPRATRLRAVGVALVAASVIAAMLALGLG